MMIVDSQVHIWGANTPERPWPARQAVKAQRDIPLQKDELLREMDAAGVNRVVIVPPSWEGERNDLAIDSMTRMVLDQQRQELRDIIERDVSQ